MCEVNRDNFHEKLPLIKKSLEKCKFVSVDLEFSALLPLQNQSPSLFDTNKERYAKFRKNLQYVIPLQVGLTAFHFDNSSNDYFGDVFNFYICPIAFADLDRAFYFQASSMQFLAFHNFDFNKFAYSGIPYLNKLEESRLKSKLESDEFFGENSQLRVEFASAINKHYPVINKWDKECKTGDFLEIGEILEKYKRFPEVIYFLHKHFRFRFKNLWTYQTSEAFVIKKVTDEDFVKLSKTCTLNREIVHKLKGFSHVFDLLSSLKKPIVGHNSFQDLMIMINNFETPLPDSYSDYKSLTHSLFPAIFDTKTLYYELRSEIPKEKLPHDTSLEDLFNYFKGGLGRHLVTDRTAIECNIKVEDFDSYHDAGWDSFCAGYIFLRMAHYNVARNYPKSKTFVTSELISGIGKYKNCVNVIRGSTSFIRIDGEDPDSTRPPWLVVQSRKNEPVDLKQLASLLSSYGSVDVKQISSKGDRVLVAVDTFRAAREISKTFTANPKFQVKQYNALRQSLAARAIIATALTVSGTILVWLTRKLMKK